MLYYIIGDLQGGTREPPVGPLEAGLRGAGHRAAAVSAREGDGRLKPIT